jgi:8-oxo-dGTP diphosphatase
VTPPGDAPAPVSTCAVAVDVALLTLREGRLQLLLVQPDAGPFTTHWALPGRRVRDDEGLDDTAHRALRELAAVSLSLDPRVSGSVMKCHPPGPS